MNTRSPVSLCIPETKALAATLLSVFWLVIITESASASPRSWTGRAGNGRWSNVNNWNPSGPPQNGDDLSFTSSGGASMNNDIPDLQIGDLYFDNDSQWNLSGYPLALSKGVRVGAFGSGNVTAKVTINCDLTLTTNVTFFIRYGGESIISADENELHLGGTVDLNGHNAFFDLEFYPDTHYLASHLYFTGVLAGHGDVTLFSSDGSCYVEFSGPIGNTFHGRMVVRGKVCFNKQNGYVVNDVLEINSEVLLNNSAQIAPGATVIVDCQGQFLFQGHDATFSDLVMGNRGGIGFCDPATCVLDTQGGTLTLLGNLSAHSRSAVSLDKAATPLIKGRLILSPGVHLFDVGGELFSGLDLQAQIAGSGDFSKSGAAALLLEANNTFTGEAIINQGMVEVRNNNALGSASGATTLAGGSLTLRNVAIAGETLHARGQAVSGEMPGSLLTTIGSCSWAGPVVLDTNLVSIGGDLTLSGLISGSGGIGFFNLGNPIITGPAANTYLGTTLVRCPVLQLNKPYFVTAIGGPLVVGGGAGGPYEVRWFNSDQNSYVNGAALTLYANGIVNLNNFDESFGPVTFHGGEVDTGSGTFTFYQPMTVNPSGNTAMINGNLFMAGNPVYFHIADGPADPDLLINAAMSGTSSIQKDGPGMLALNGASTFSGALFISDGIVNVMYDLALGSSAIGSGTIVRNGATLHLAPGVTLREQLSLSGAGFAGLGALHVSGDTTFSSPFPALNYFDLNGPTTVRVEGLTSLFILNGIVSGTGPFTKAGPGRLLMTGGSYPNSYTGDTFAVEGILELNKPPSVVSIPGDLVLGPPPAAGALAVARFVQNGQMGGTVVTANGNSLLDLNGTTLRLSQVNLRDGARVQTGTGNLGFPIGGGVVAVGSQDPLGSHVSSSITGNISLPVNSSVAFQVSPYAPFPPFASEPELDVPAGIHSLGPPREAGIIKDGYGQMRLSGANNFAGAASVLAGTLIVASPSALGTSQGGTYAYNGASLQLDDGIAITNEYLLLDSTNRAALNSNTGSNTWSGTIYLNRNTGIQVASGYLQALGQVTGPGGLTKLGLGTLQFWGSVANDYAGLTTISQGVLEAGRANQTSIPGNVMVGDNSTSSTIATVRSLREQQFIPTADVYIYNSGLLDLFPIPGLAPPQATLRTVPGGGRINLGAGTSLSISNPVTFIFSGSISGSGALIKQAGAGGTMVMSGDSPAFTGPTTVGGRDYLLNGNYGNSPVTVLGGGRLRGDGVAGNVTVQASGALAVDSKVPGRNGGDLEMASLNLSSGAMVSLNLFGSSANGGNDELIVNGPASLANATLSLGFDYPPHEGDVLTLLSKTTAGLITGGFTGWVQGATRRVGTVPVVASYTGGDGNDFILTVTNLPLAYFSYRLVEGNGNQTVEPNECNLLYVSLVNRRTSALTLTNVVLHSLTDGATVTIGRSSYPVIPAGGVRESLTPFQFRTDASLPCGTPIIFELVLDVAGEGEFAIVVNLVSGSDCAHPTGPCESCTVVRGQFTPSTPATVAPLSFAGAPSICYPVKLFPGADPAPALPGMQVVQHPFLNPTTNELCLTAQLHFDCPGAQTNALGVAAYLADFSINHPSAGYLGDGGVGGPPYPPFSFRVPAGSNFLVTVTARTTNLLCHSYTLELFGLPCPSPTLAIAHGAAPNDVRVNWSTAYPGWMAQQQGALGGDFTDVTEPPAIVNGRYAMTNVPASIRQFYRLRK